MVLEGRNMASVVEFEAGRDDWTRRVRFASDDIELRPNAATQIAVGLLPAMRHGMEPGAELAVEGSIDSRLYGALNIIQDIQTAWVPNLRRVEVRCPVAESPARSGSRVGCFFTGGVDSFYTLLKHQDVITDLIFVHGYDVSLEDLSLRKRVSDAVRQVAAACGKGVVEVETDVREFLNPQVEWGAAHGAALAAVGHLLSPQFGTVYIASSYSYADLFPWGSHPLLDPLWSDQAVEFVHDGCEARRHEKVGFIAKHKVALRHLRVCWQNPGGAYNCGRCDKCLRTMINLEIAGALPECSTFHERLDPKRVARMRIGSESERVFAMQNLRELAKQQPDSQIFKALRAAVRRAAWRQRGQRLRRVILGKRLNARLQRWT